MDVKKARAFRFSDHTLKLLDELSKALGMDRTATMVMGINVLATQEARRIKEWQQLEKEKALLQFQSEKSTETES
jgi:hypothetical protein